jgi:predicted ATPase
VEHQVFICHSSADVTVARDICVGLENAGLRCWIAPRDPLPGMPYGQQIVSAIEATRVVLLVFSSNANGSRAVLGELELAANRGKIVLPVRIEDVQPSPNLEFYVRAIHWFDAATRPLDQTLPELVRDVRMVLPDLAVAEDGVGAPDSTPRKASNLPIQVTSFVGRERDVGEIKDLVDSGRLVTLVGSGGAGKTRTAVAVGEELAGTFADGVRFIELAPIADGSIVAATIARALGARESANRSTSDSILEYLKSKNLLVVIDNCEHVIDEVRALAGAVLHGCPGVRILATSRESLNIAGERVFRIPSLEVPPQDHKLNPKIALRYGAIALFADRARSADGRFTLTAANVPFVAEICRRLDGIPLAIELAAARVRVLSPRQLAEKLDERFRLLTGGDRSALPRHQTMRALIDWSYDLLSEQERATFRRVSIFADGFTLRGACAICGDCDELAVLDLLSSLIDKSLLQADPDKEDRFRLLESTREYAREKLAESGESESCAKSHLRYLKEVFTSAGDEYEATMSGAAVSGLSVELEDSRSALAWGINHCLDDAVDLFLATRLWANLGLHREGIERSERLLALIGEADAARLARLWERIALCAGGIGSAASAREAAERAMHYARISNDAGILADCLLRYADVIAHARRFENAVAALDEAESLGDLSPRRRLQGFHTRSLIGSLRGDLGAAARSWAQIRDLYASVENDIGVVSAALNLAELEHAQGATGEAIKTATSALSRAERLPDRSMRAQLLLNLAGYLSAAGDVKGAHHAATRALAYFASTDPEGTFTAIALEHLALCIAREGDLHQAATIEGYVENTFARLGFEREYTESTTHEKLMELLAAHTPLDELAALLARGKTMEALDAVAGATRKAAVT